MVPAVVHALLLCLPIFAVIGLGFLAIRRRIVPPVMIEAVGAFAFTFALPAMLFRLMATQPLAEIVDARFLASYLGACLATLVGVLGAAAVAGVRPARRAAAFGTAAAFGNVGYLGPPLLLPLLGERVSGPIAMAIMAEVAVILMLGEVLMARPGGRDGGPLGRAFRALSRNPVILSILAGTAVGALGLPLPGPFDRFLAFLGGAAGPTALFALGGTLGGLLFRRRLLATASPSRWASSRSTRRWPG
jgi:malonate transporter and related proteins